jgi:hypothetical protein
MRLSLIFGAIWILSSCATKETDQEILFKGDYLIVGHKGSGPSSLYENSNFPENSLDGMVNALKQLDGVEMDLQVSQDGIFWLFHDHEINIGTEKPVNFHALPDTVIERYSHIHFSGKLIRLEDLLGSDQVRSFKRSVFCLDLKFLANPMVKTRSQYCVSLKRILISHLKKNQDQRFFLEVYGLENLERLKSRQWNTLLVQNSVHPVLNAEVNHSFSYDLARNSFFRQGRFKKSVWVLNEPEDFRSVHTVHPTLVQTDFPAMGKLIKKMRNRPVSKRTLKDTSAIIFRDEYFPLLSFEPESELPDLLKITINRFSGMDSCMLVISINGRNGSLISWNSYELNSGSKYIFIDREQFTHRNYTKADIYLWNQRKKHVRISDLKITSYH